MRNFSCKTFVTTAAALLMFSTVALAESHGVLNGTWTLVPERSQLNGEPAIESGTVTFNNAGRNVNLTQHFTVADPAQSIASSFTMNGRTNNAMSLGANSWSLAKWEGHSLQVNTTQNGVTSEESYSLQPDGMLMLTYERPGHKTITLFFQRS